MKFFFGSIRIFLLFTQLSTRFLKNILPKFLEFYELSDKNMLPKCVFYFFCGSHPTLNNLAFLTT
jgi:hypothetical protein